MEKRSLIIIDEGNLEELVEQVAERLLEKLKVPQEQWIGDKEAMRLLGVKKTTLQKYRDEGKIRFSQPSKKIIQYDRFSIDEFLEKNAKETF